MENTVKLSSGSGRYGVIISTDSKYGSPIDALYNRSPAKIEFFQRDSRDREDIVTDSHTRNSTYTAETLHPNRKPESINGKDAESEFYSAIKRLSEFLNAKHQIKAESTCQDNIDIAVIVSAEPKPELAKIA